MTVPPQSSSLLKECLAAISLANLCFLTVWRELIFASDADWYWLPDYGAATYGAIILNIALLSIILWATIRYLIHSQYRWQQVVGTFIFFAFLIFPINYLRLILDINDHTVQLAKENWVISIALAAMLLAVGIYVILFQLSRVTQITIVVCIVLSPFAVFNLIQAGWFIVGNGSVMASTAVSNPSKATSSDPTRIVWIIMDELDVRLAFLDRPPGLELPEFDRLRGEALFASNATSYSRNTEEAIPSYMVQKIVKQAKPLGPDSLWLTFHEVEDAKDGELKQFPHFFSEAANAGSRVAIIGYYHPYCRLFGRYAAYCTRFALNTYSPRATNNIGREMLNQILGITPFFRRINGITTYLDMADSITQLASDQRYDVVYLHASVPHGPNIWNSRKNQFTLVNSSRSGYFDNLQLADRLLGKMRESMEKSGLWNNSVVLLTSDHEWRHVYLHDNQRTRKVPFVLKMPNQTRPLEFKPKFAPMRLTKDLLLQIQRGAIMTASGAAEWIEKRRLQAQ